MATLKESVSKEVWEVIKDNYEKGSYTTAITNLLQFVNEIVREKSGLNFDGTALMDKAFLGNNPTYKINKHETQTEKDIQQGIGYLLKGMCLAIRNPRSHERYNDDIITANRIILFVDYLLRFIINNKYGNLIEDWIDIILDEDFSNDEEYANELFKALPQKKRYDLLINIFRNKSKINSLNTTKFIKLLIDNISDKGREDFFESLSKELMTIKNEDALYNFFKIYPPELWDKISIIPKIRIESMVKNSIEKGQIEYEFDNFGNYLDSYLSEESKLVIVAKRHMQYFSNKKKIIEEIANCITSNITGKREYFDDYLIEILDLNDDCVDVDILTWTIDFHINKDEKNKKLVNLIKRKVKIEKKHNWINAFERQYDENILNKKTLRPIIDDELPF